jgi:hypothetical protein
MQWPAGAPDGLVVHATGLPTLGQWVELGPAHDARLKNLEAFYQGMGWQHGPHAFVSRSHINGFSSLLARGTHCTCENYKKFGMEQAGNFNTGFDPYMSGDGLLVRTMAVLCAATLALKFKFTVYNIIPHSACKKDGHSQCPGNENDMNYFRASVDEKMAELTIKHPELMLRQSAPPPAKLLGATAPWTPPISSPFFQLAARAYNKWIALGMPVFGAYGMLAQEWGESGFNIRALGDRDSAFGIHQQHRDRCAAILAGTGIDLTTFPSLERQIEAAWWELHRSEHVALAAILAATSAENAGEVACRAYERPGGNLQPPLRGIMAGVLQTIFTAHPELLADNPAQP